MNYNFSSTLMGNLDCGQKLKYYLERTERPQGSAPAAERGIKLHQYCEQFLKGETVTCENKDEHETFQKIIPFLESIFNKVVGTEQLRLGTPEQKKLIGLRDGDNPKGIVDAILGDGTILDWKFVGEQWKAERFIDYVRKQGWFYLWLFPEAPKLIFVVVPKNGPLKEWELIRDDEKIEHEAQLWRSMNQDIQSMIEFDAFHATPSPWKCRFCNFRTICPAI